jgi:two-component system NarL family response regulator
MPDVLRIVIADDHALFRQGLKSLLTLQPGMSVVGEVENASEIAPTVTRTQCDILLLDLRMDRSSIADIEGLARRVPVLVVTASERPADAVAALRAGARGVVFKRFAIDSLMEAIRAVTAGHVWVPPSVQSQLAAQMSKPVPETLTSREQEIVRHVALGARNAEVAARLSITEVTVKAHLNRIFQKLEVRDRVELALYAIRVGLIGVHDPSR